MGLCFQCGDRFTLRLKCKNKKLYSLCIIENKKDNKDVKNEVEKNNSETITPFISLNVLEKTVGFHTLRVNGRRDKHLVFILIDSGSTHDFLSTESAKTI